MLIQPGQMMTRGKCKHAVQELSLLDADPQAIFELDVTQAASYDPGVSGLLKNLVPQPWDGEAQSAYDFAPNAGANFVGEAGSIGAYLESTGTMQIPLSGPTPAFFNNLHRTDITQEFSLVVVWYNPAAVINGQMVLLGNAATNTDNGFNFRVEIGNSRYSFRQHNGSVQSATYIGGPFDKLDAWNLIIWSFSRVPTPGKSRKWANSQTGEEKNLTTFNTATAAPAKSLQISGVLGSSKFKSGQRLRYAAALGGFMTDERAAAIIDYLQTQHQTSYV